MRDEKPDCPRCENNGSRSVPVETSKALAENGNRSSRPCPQSDVDFLTWAQNYRAEPAPGIDYNKLDEVGGRDLRLQRTAERLRRGVCVDGQELFIFKLCQDYGVSYRTAHRHARAATTPGDKRKVGRDGKSYPDRATSISNQTRVELRKALRSLKRAASHIGENGLAGADSDFLREIQSYVAALLSKQEGCQ